MSIDRAVLAFAGIMVLVSLLLTHFVHPGFVGSPLYRREHATVCLHGFCPAAMIFRKLGLRPGTAF